MAIKNQALTVCYWAWDTSNNVGKTGDSGNHTLRLVQDGSEATPGNSPSEVDATNLPGVYKIALTAGEMNYNYVVLGGKSSTSGIVISPIFISTERGIVGTNLDATVSSRSTLGGTAQTGDAYAIVNSGTYGNSAIKTAINVIPSSVWSDILPGSYGASMAGFLVGHSFTGAGNTAVNHDTGGADNMRCVYGGNPVSGATIYAYTKANYDLKNFSQILGVSTTDANGRWVSPIYLFSGTTYTIAFFKTGSFSTVTKEITI